MSDKLIKSDELGQHPGNFLELHPDDYSSVEYTPEELEGIRKHMTYMATGSSSSIPIYCSGEKSCPFKENCPFIRVDRKRRSIDPKAPLSTPIGKKCRVEMNLLNEWTRLYVEEYKVDNSNFTDFQMVRELAEVELLLWRINNNIAKPINAELVQDDIVAVSHDGTPMTKRDINVFFSLKEKLQNRKTRLVKLLVGDRQEKYKREAALRIRSEDDPSSSASELKTKIQRLIKQTKELSEKVKESKDVIDIEQELLPDDIIG